MKITIRNYIFAAILVIATMVITLIIRNFYINQKNLDNISVSSFLSEIKAEELNSYIIEKHDTMLLVTDGVLDQTMKEFKKIVVKNNYNEDIAYIKFDEKQDLQNLINFSKDLINIKVSNNSLLIIKNGVVENIIDIDKNSIAALKQTVESEFYKI